MPAPEEALAFKKRGNEAFSKHEWLNAVDAYSKAIEVYSSDPVFYCNRCQVSQVWYFRRLSRIWHGAQGAHKIRAVWLRNCRCNKCHWLRFIVRKSSLALPRGRRVTTNNLGILSKGCRKYGHIEVSWGIEGLQDRCQDRTQQQGHQAQVGRMWASGQENCFWEGNWSIRSAICFWGAGYRWHFRGR